MYWGWAQVYVTDTIYMYTYILVIDVMMGAITVTFVISRIQHI